jgi:hypothetical protein
MPVVPSDKLCYRRPMIKQRTSDTTDVMTMSFRMSVADTPVWLVVHRQTAKIGVI